MTTIDQTKVAGSHVSWGAYSGWRIAQGILGVLPLALLFFFGYQRRWVSEDAFIDLRIVENLLAGHGPVFNIDERVEAYTNPLWVALLALWGAVGGRLEAGALWLGLLLSVAGLGAAQAGALLIWRRGYGHGVPTQPRIALPLGAAVIAAVPAAWDFATSGLETGLTFGWLGGTFWLLARAYDARAETVAAHSETTDEGNSTVPEWQWLGTAVMVGLGPLIRPDMAVFSAGFMVVLLLLYVLSPSRRRKVAGLAMLVLMAASLPLAYQIFRMGYFASLAPNTALAKQAGSAYWSQGLVYLSDFLSTYAIWLPLLPLMGWLLLGLLGAVRRHDLRTVVVLAAPVLSAAVHIVYVVRVGGDFMHGRLLLSGLFGLLLPVAAVYVPLRSPGARSILGAGAVAVPVLAWAVVCATFLRVPYEERAGPKGNGFIADERGWYARIARHPNPVTIGDYAATRFVKDATWLRSQVERKASTVAKASARMPDAGSEGNRKLYLWRGSLRRSSIGIKVDPSVSDEVELVAVRGNIGLMGYIAGPRVHIVDRFGLADPIAARLILKKRSRPGHEVRLPVQWVLARYGHPATATDDERTMAAREALSCGRLNQMIAAVEEPLTVGRFLENIRLAPSLYRLRIPPDPLVARGEFCAER